MKYKPGTKWNIRPTPEQELEDFQNYARELRERIKADPEVGKRLMIDAGIWDENGKLTEKYRDPEQS